jgi:hypothetical protein
MSPGGGSLPIVLVIVLALVFLAPFRLGLSRIEDEHEHDNEHD